MTKALTPTEMSKGQSDNTNNATKKFDYTAVADRLRTVSWSNYSHPTGVFKCKIVWNCNIPSISASACLNTFGHFFDFLNYLVWLRIIDEGLMPEIRIFSIIKRDLKW